MQVNASSERPLADDYLSLSAHGAQFFLQLEQDKAIKSVLQIFISTAYSITLNDLVIQLNATLESPLSFILELYDQGYFLSAKHSSKVPESSDLSSVLESFSYLSLGGKSALADANGFQLAQSGFETDQAEQLCALSAEMLSWQSRRQTLFNEISEGEGLSLSIVNKKGKSALGFWPIYIGNQSLVLILLGRPRFDQRELGKLLYLLGNYFL